MFFQMYSQLQERLMNALYFDGAQSRRHADEIKSQTVTIFLSLCLKTMRLSYMVWKRVIINRNGVKNNILQINTKHYA